MVIRFDNGPEYISATLAIWATKQGIALTRIQPGKPQHNAYVARYNRTVRHEWLDLSIFETIAEAQSSAADWLWTGYGLTTTSAPTWASAPSHPHSN